MSAHVSAHAHRSATDRCVRPAPRTPRRKPVSSGRSRPGRHRGQGRMGALAGRRGSYASRPQCWHRAMGLVVFFLTAALLIGAASGEVTVEWFSADNRSPGTCFNPGRLATCRSSAAGRARTRLFRTAAPNRAPATTDRRGERLRRVQCGDLEGRLQHHERGWWSSAPGECTRPGSWR